MREIKFRGKRTDNGEWCEGYLTRRPSAIQYEGHYSPWFIDVPPQDPDDSGGLYNVERETVGEFTGLSDKNGKEIFEGDIVFDTIDRENDLIIFERGAFCIKNSHTILRLGRTLSTQIKVIGNIHDNGELMEREAEE